MHQHIRTYLRNILLIIGILFTGAKGFANHIVGADLYYTHVSGNTYKITFIAYGDCGPASAASFAYLPTARPQICIFDSSTYVGTISLRIDTPANPQNGREITPVCPADSNMTQCTNPAYTI